MASLNSWLTPADMHALGWSIIHSLWQCIAIAALAAALMAFSRRPSIRYFAAVGALVAMLAVPVATFFILMKSAPAQAILPVTSGLPASSNTVVFGSLATANVFPVAATPTAIGNGEVSAFENFSRVLPSPSDFSSPDVLPCLVVAWLSGVVVFSLRFAGGFLLLEHKHRRQSFAPSPRIIAMCQEVQHQLGLDRAIRYLECGWLQAPAVIGWIRPVILLPVLALTGLTEEQLRAVIAHELAHIRRLDSFVNLFQILVETLLFYHPAVWWLNKQIRAERELCCDEIAVLLTGNRLEYARALTTMAEWKSAPILAMAANRGPLSERILYILGQKPFGVGQRMIGLTGGVIFLTAALVAANALFGIADPIPIAHASESPRAALSSTRVTSSTDVALSSQITNNQVERPPPQANQPTTKSSDMTLDHRSLNNGPTGETISAPNGEVEHTNKSQPERLVPPSSAELAKLLPSESFPLPIVVALNETPTAPAQPASNASPAVTVASSDQPIAPVQPATPQQSVGSVHAPMIDPAATPAKTSSNQVPVAYICHNSSVIGRVISPVTIQMRSFFCFTQGSNIDGINFGTSTIPAGISFGSCPYDMTSVHYSQCQNPPVTMNVRLAEAADAAKMQPGKHVALGGNFRVAQKNHIAFLIVTNAKILHEDPFGQ